MNKKIIQQTRGTCQRITKAACSWTRENPEQQQEQLEGDRLRSRRRRTLETLDDHAGRLEADRMRVSRQRALETPVHRDTRLEAERGRSRRRREARIPTQADDHVKRLTEEPERNSKTEERWEDIYRQLSPQIHDKWVFK